MSEAYVKFCHFIEEQAETYKRYILKRGKDNVSSDTKEISEQLKVCAEISRCSDNFAEFEPEFRKQVHNEMLRKYIKSEMEDIKWRFSCKAFRSYLQYKITTFNQSIEMPKPGEYIPASERKAARNTYKIALLLLGDSQDLEQFKSEFIDFELDPITSFKILNALNRITLEVDYE